MFVYHHYKQTQEEGLTEGGGAGEAKPAGEAGIYYSYVCACMCACVCVMCVCVQTAQRAHKILMQSELSAQPPVKTLRSWLDTQFTL